MEVNNNNLIILFAVFQFFNLMMLIDRSEEFFNLPIKQAVARWLFFFLPVIIMISLSYNPL
jgi:hypothetical protein